MPQTSLRSRFAGSLLGSYVGTQYLSEPLSLPWPWETCSQKTEFVPQLFTTARPGQINTDYSTLAYLSLPWLLLQCERSQYAIQELVSLNSHLQISALGPLIDWAHAFCRLVINPSSNPEEFWDYWCGWLRRSEHLEFQRVGLALHTNLSVAQLQSQHSPTISSALAWSSFCVAATPDQLDICLQRTAIATRNLPLPTRSVALGLSGAIAGCYCPQQTLEHFDDSATSFERFQQYSAALWQHWSGFYSDSAGSNAVYASRTLKPERRHRLISQLELERKSH
ncbi:MAG: hypothetical protein AAGG02_04560 [Cyanobacteria bacterium P01_H01_bin.15]